MTDPRHINEGFTADEIDTSKPHPARMYDYYLGGWDNYEADRVAAEKVIALNPRAARLNAVSNREFMHRSVRTAVRAGIRQILDIGTGIPTSPNTHEVAREIAPDTRVAYIDNDPIVATHAGAKLTNAGNAGFLLADVREPDAILEHPVVKELIDFDQPVALLLVSVLPFVRNEERPAELVRKLTERLVPGSYLAISHMATEFFPELTGEASNVYKDASASLTIRPLSEVVGFFDGFELLDPGVVQVSRWRPDGPAPTAEELEGLAVCGGLGVKR